MPIFEDFDAVFSGLTKDLSNLLESRILPNEPEARTPIGRTLAAIMRFHLAEDRDHRDWNVLRLALLEKQLRVIADKRPDIFARYRSRLLREDDQHYFGTRFEILVAANLAYVDRPFSNPDPPDFLVPHRGADLALECTSVVFKGANPSRLRVKLRKALNKKARGVDTYSHLVDDPYRIAVFIDATNLFHASDRRGRIFLPQDVADYLGRRLSKLEMGACVVFTLVLDRTTESLEAVYVRVDHASISDNLFSFMNESFPVNQARTFTDYLFPPIT